MSSIIEKVKFNIWNAQCLINSSNVCMAQISHLVGLETQKRFLSETGLLDEQFIELYEMGKPIFQRSGMN